MDQVSSSWNDSTKIFDTADNYDQVDQINHGTIIRPTVTLLAQLGHLKPIPLNVSKVLQILGKVTPVRLVVR